MRKFENGGKHKKCENVKMRKCVNGGFRFGGRGRGGKKCVSSKMRKFENGGKHKKFVSSKMRKCENGRKKSYKFESSKMRKFENGGKHKKFVSS